MEAYVLPNQMQSNFVQQPDQSNYSNYLQSNHFTNQFQQPANNLQSDAIIFNAPLQSFMMVNDKKTNQHQSDFMHPQQTIQIPVIITDEAQEEKTTVKRFKI